MGIRPLAQKAVVAGQELGAQMMLLRLLGGSLPPDNEGDVDGKHYDPVLVDPTTSMCKPYNP